MNWTVVYNDTINIFSTPPLFAETRFADLSVQNLLFFVTSPDARETWDLALTLGFIVQIPGLTAEPIEVEFFRSSVLLNRYSLVSLPYLPAETYSIIVRIPHWFSQIHLQVWQSDTPMLIKSFAQLSGASSKPNVGDVKMGLFLVSGDFFTDPDGWLWVVPNGKKLANSSTANDELHLTDGEATYNAPILKGLFTHLWNLNAFTVSPSRGATAEADWSNGKRLILPDWRGRSPMGEGQGQGLTARALGEVVGDEAIALTESQMPSHNHTGGTGVEGWHNHTGSTNTTGNHAHTMGAADNAPVSGSYTRVGGVSYQQNTSTAGNHSHSLSINGNGNHSHPISLQGEGASHPNIHPIFVCSILLATGEKNPL